MDALISPTPYRLAKHHGDIDAPEISQTTRRYAYRLVGLAEKMFRDKKLEEHEWKAYQQFEKDAERAAKLPPCIGSYGQVRGVDDDQNSDWSPLDSRLAAHRRAIKALDFVGGRHAEALIYAVLNPTNLETVGRLFSKETSKSRCCAVGAEIIETACERLAVHYGLANTRASPKAA